MKERNQTMGNLTSAGLAAANSTVRTSGNLVVGLARWASTDNSGMSSSLPSIYGLGFFTLECIIMRFLFAVAGAILTGIWVFLLIGYGIPFFLSGHF